MYQYHFVRLLALLMMVSIASTNVYARVNEDHPYSFNISKHTYQFSEVYQISSHQHNTYPGTVKKSVFRVRTNYDLSNKEGWQATGVKRFVSVGALYPWATDIDIYDTRNVQIGLIDGNFATLESAKFNIYEYNDVGNFAEVGIAYGNSDFTHFVIVPSMSDPRPIAELNRNYNDRTWHVSVHCPEKMDDRILRIFAAFVIDYQDKFLPPSEE